MTASRKKNLKDARVIAIANQKGGVGKSTTAVSLGAALAEAGHPVLVLDLDPQGNASTGMGIRHDDRETTIYEVLVSEAPIADAIVQTPVENLWAVPSTIDLAGAEIELVSQFSRELRLKKALGSLETGRFEFVFLDCPPSLGLLTVNALAASAELIVPIQCEYYALEGLSQLLRNVGLVQQNINQGLRLSGIVMTMFDPRTKLSEQVVEEVRKYFGPQVYDTIIPRTVRLSEAPGYGEPITVYDPRSRGAECYRDLAREVLERPIPKGAGVPQMEEVPEIVVAPPVRPAGDPGEGEASEEPRAGPASGAVKKDRAVEAEADDDAGAEPKVATDAPGLDVEPVSGPERGREHEPEPEPAEEVLEPVAREDAEFDREDRTATADLPADVLVAEATVVVEDLTEVEGIASPSDNGVVDEERGKKKWRLFRKGGDA